MLRLFLFFEGYFQKGQLCVGFSAINLKKHKRKKMFPYFKSTGHKAKGEVVSAFRFAHLHISILTGYQRKKSLLKAIVLSSWPLQQTPAAPTAS